MRTGTVVQLVCLLIFASGIRFDGLLDRLNGTAEKVGVTHVCAYAGLHATAVFPEVSLCVCARFGLPEANVEYDGDRSGRRGAVETRLWVCFPAAGRL